MKNLILQFSFYLWLIILNGWVIASKISGIGLFFKIMFKVAAVLSISYSAYRLYKMF